jgi:predicted PurR-regulated permease PerM
MFTHLPRRQTRPRTPARQAAASPRRLAAALAAATCALLASAAVIPAAWAMIPYTGGTPVVHVVTEGGMPGWQITLIALGAALVAATAAVLLDRAWAARRPTLSRG